MAVSKFKVGDRVRSPILGVRVVVCKEAGRGDEE